MHVVTVVYEFNAGPISDKGQRSRRSSISGLNWRGGCSLQQGLVSWRHRLNQHSQLAITMLLRSVVMKYQQRRDFLVDPHNRIAHELWISLFVFSVYCCYVYPRKRWVFSRNIRGHSP